MGSSTGNSGIPGTLRKDLEVEAAQALGGLAPLAPQTLYIVGKGTAGQPSAAPGQRARSCLRLKAVLEEDTEWRGMACSFPYCSESPGKGSGCPALTAAPTASLPAPRVIRVWVYAGHCC